MNKVVIDIKNLSKKYKLGTISSGTLRQDIASYWARICNKEDPNLKVNFLSNQNILSKDNVMVLKDINLQIQRGEIIGVIGKNGAGKSTLLKILSRITAPSQGTVNIKGRVASLLEVGTGFHPELTGRENIYLNGAILGMTKNEIDDRLGDIIQFSGIQSYIDTPVKRYSSGMTVRLGFSVAAHLEPDILLVDEVLAVGDIKFQKKCLSKIQDISHSGITVIFVSHNLSSIKALCEKTVCLDEGQIFCTGETDYVIKKYYEKNFISQIKIPLEDRRDRKGNGRFLFNSICFENNDKQSNGIIISGETLKISINYKLVNYNNNSNIIVSIGVKSYFGEYLLLFRNDFTDETIKVSQNDTIICTIPNFPLIAGKYVIDLHSTVDNEILDFIETAAVINVVEGNFFGTGKQKHSAFGPFLAKHNWSAVKNNLI